MAAVAFELTAMAAFDEEGLNGYVQQRTAGLHRGEITELVTMLAAVSAGTYEAWAEDTGQSLPDMLQRASLALANNPVEEVP